MGRTAHVLLTALVVLAAAAATAAADADPASDVLVSSSIYYPYGASVSDATAQQLDGVVKQAGAQRYPIKVALIAAPQDLGAVNDVFGQPERYAAFLSVEISFNKKVPVLVVMPSGLAVVNADARAKGALREVTPPGQGAEAVAQAAVAAVAVIARSQGLKVSTVKATATGKAPPKRSSTSPLVYLAPVLLVLLGIGGARAVERRRSRRSGDDPA